MSRQSKNTSPNCKKFPVGRPSAVNAAKRMENLLDVAFEVFTEQGYQRSSIAEIARRAGTSKQTIYSRFRTKGELFKAVIQRGSDELHAMFLRVLDPSLPTEATLRSYGRNLAGVILDPNGLRLFRTIIGAADSFPELAEFFWSITSVEGDKILSDYFAELNRRGRLSVGDTTRAAGFFNNLCVGPLPLLVLMNLPHAPDCAALEAQVQEAVRIFLAAYAPSGGGPEAQK